MSKAIIICDGYDLKEHFGESVIITINVPVKSRDGKIKGYQFHSREYATLKAMPEKTKIKMDEISKNVFNEIFGYDPEAFQDGWNDCVDYILRRGTNET